MKIIQKILVILFINFLPVKVLADAESKMISCYSEVLVKYAARENNVTEDFAREIFAKTPEALSSMRDAAVTTSKLHSEGKEGEIEKNIQELEVAMPGTSEGFLKCYEIYKTNFSEVDLNKEENDSGTSRRTALHEKSLLCKAVAYSSFGNPMENIEDLKYPLEHSVIYSFSEKSPDEINIVTYRIRTEQKVDSDFGYDYTIFNEVSSDVEKMKIKEFPNNIVLSNMKEKSFSGKWEDFELTSDRQNLSDFISKFVLNSKVYSSLGKKYELKGDSIFINRSDLSLSEIILPLSIINISKCELIDSSELDELILDMTGQAKSYYAEELNRLKSMHSTGDNKL